MLVGGLKSIKKYVFFANIPIWIREIQEHLMTQEMCNEAVEIKPHPLKFVSDQYKTKEMCHEAVSREPYTLDYVPDHFKTQEMFNEVM